MPKNEVLAEFELEETFSRGVFVDSNRNMLNVTEKCMPEHTGGLIAKVQLIKRTDAED